MRRTRDLAELCVGYGLILAVLWTPAPWQRRLYLLTAAVLLVASLRPGVGWRALGLSTTNLLRSSVVVLPVTFLAGATYAVAAHLHTLHAPAGPAAVFRRFWGYGLWSLAQQFLLQNYFLLRFRRLLPGRTGAAILLSAGIFAIAHLPNPILTVLTLVWGTAACALFVRYASLYPLGVAHALLGITVAVCVPARITHNMRVGLGYLTFHPVHGHHHRSSSDHTVSTRV